MINKRQSNLELLRVCCMFSIIIGHIMTQTQAKNLQIQDGFNYFFGTFCGNGVRLMINCFVMIGAWFLVDKEFQARRVINLWLEIFFYSVILDSLCMIFQIGDWSIIWEVQAFFPIMGRPIWFGAEYICMLLLSPFMNQLLHRHACVCKKLLLLIGGGIILCATIFPIEHTTPVYSDLVWFCFLYLLIGYIKLYNACIVNKKKYYALVAFVLWILLWCIQVGADWLKNDVINSIADYFWGHFENVISFGCSYCLFQLFRNINIGIKPWINSLSNSIFAVYLVHQTRAFYPFLWESIYHVDEMVYSKWFWVYLIFIVLSLFISCMFVDKIRLVLFEKTVYRSKIYTKVCNSLDKWYEV